MVHELKILPKYFKDVVFGYKNFELRKNDRNYLIGDTIILKEWDGEKYTGLECKRFISYILHGTGEYGLQDGYCILGLKSGNLVPLE